MGFLLRVALFSAAIILVTASKYGLGGSGEANIFKHNLQFRLLQYLRVQFASLKTHRDMFFNPKFGRLGMLSYPYWFFYEWLAPILEFFGFFTIIIFYYLGILNWDFFIAITLAVYSFSIMFSFYAVLWEVYSYNQYTKTRDILILLLCAIIEPITFHPIVVWSAIKGNYKKLFKIQSGWGSMTRKGFTKA